MLLATDNPVEWLGFVATVSVSIIGAVVTVTAMLWKLSGRLDRVEGILLTFAENLKSHQQDDCKQLNDLHESVGKLIGPVAKIVEAVEWTKTTLETDRSYVHERISEHDQRNKDSVEQYLKKFDRELQLAKDDAAAAKAEATSARAEVEELKRRN